MSAQGVAVKRQPTLVSPERSPEPELGWCTQDTVQPLHKGAKWEDGEGLGHSRDEACLQTKEYSEKGTITGEEQDPRAETDRSGLQDLV